MHLKDHAVNLFITTGTLCFIVLSLYAVKGVYPFGEHLMFWGDLPQQGIPWLYDAYDVFTGKASSDFSWRYSCGLDGNSSILSNLFDLPILFINREYIYKFFSILLLLKMCCMSIAMYFFTCRYSVERKYHILASVLYGMGSCVLIHYQIGYVMLDIAILFPILMAGFYDLMEKNRPLLYITLLTLCICKSVYVSFMVCMYLFTISIPYFYFCVPRDMFWIKCRNFIISTCIAAGLSSIFLLSMLSSLGDSNRIAWSGADNSGSGGTYLRAIIDQNSFSYYSGLSMLCFFMGSTLPIVSIRIAWNKLKGRLRYHKAQLILLLLAAAIPGTEVLWHGGSHTLWTLRFAFILNFVFLEIFLVIAQEGLLDFLENYPVTVRKKVLLVIIFLICIVTIELLLRELYARALFLLLFATVMLILLWLLFYAFLCNQRTNIKTSLLCIALCTELYCTGFLWIAPEFEKISTSVEQITPDWNTVELNRYIPIASKLSTEIDRSRISPLHRTRDIDNSFNSNYAAITDTYSIANFRGSIPNWVNKLYLCLGYGSEYVRVLDSGGTLFSDALLGIHSAFTTGKSLSEEFYQEDNSIQSVRWYWSRYTLPTGIVLKENTEIDENIFDYQNHIFQALTGKDEKLIQELVYPLKSTCRIQVKVEGRKELYFYIDNLYKFSGKKMIDSLSINGKVYPIPNLTEEENLEYPVEFNNRLLDLGTFENETVLLEVTPSRDNDPYNIRIGLLDIPMMKQAFDDIQKDNIVDHVEVGPSSVYLHQISPSSGSLFLPVLYSNCWTCEVNGVPADIRSVLGGFVGIPVDSGENEIRMIYTPKTSTPGRIIVLLSIIGVIVFLYIEKTGQLGNGLKPLDCSLGVCYISCSAIFVLLIYIVPLITFIFNASRKLMQ